MHISGIGRVSTIGQVSASTLGTTITGSGSANAKGSYSQLSASTPHDAQAVIIQMRTNLNGMTALVDFAMGASSSEVDFISGLLCQGPRGVFTYYLPIYVPKGVRISARAQNSSSSGTIFVTMMLLENTLSGEPSVGRVTCYGGNTGDSGATSVDPGGSANTKGSYTQIVASTTRAHKGLMMAVNIDKNTATTSADWLYDIAVGGAGSEQIIVPDFWVNQAVSGTNAQTPAQSPVFWLTIPASSRLAVRSQCTTTDATDRLNDVMLIGVD